MDDSTQARFDAYGGAGERSAWEMVLHAYDEDDLDAAMHLVARLGIGHAGHALFTVRMIEAEYASTQGARLFPLGPEAELELEARFEDIVATYLKMQWEEATENVRERLGLALDPPVRLTLLVPEVDAPWTPGRHGFCVQKNPYFKICLPAALLNDEPELDEAIRHEYTHAVAGFLAEEHLPTWLHEALAMRMGGSISHDYREGLRAGRIDWMDPDELEGAFEADRETDEGATLIREAYQQSRVLSDYLCSLRGESGLGECLMAFTDNSFWQTLKMRAVGTSDTDEALEQVYKMNARRLFDAARVWMVGA
jgi:hypothetical protein